MSKLNQKVLEIAKLASECPENLQVVCFELLLKHHLDSMGGAAAKGKGEQPSKTEDEINKTTKEKVTPEEVAKSQDDLAMTDLHVKAKQFLKKHSISIDDLNNIFYKENDEILPLYEDLQTTTMAESQVRIAMLQSLQRALSTGEFSAEVESVRQECNDRKCYAGGNFAANFTNNADNFDFEKFSKEFTTVKLSADGRKALADVVRELQ